MKLESGMFCLGTKENLDALVKNGVKPGCLGYDLVSGENYLLIVGQEEPFGLYNREIFELIPSIDTEIILVNGEWQIGGTAFSDFEREIDKENDAHEASWNQI